MCAKTGAATCEARATPPRSPLTQPPPSPIPFPLQPLQSVPVSVPVAVTLAVVLATALAVRLDESPVQPKPLSIRFRALTTLREAPPPRRCCRRRDQRTAKGSKCRLFRKSRGIALLRPDSVVLLRKPLEAGRTRLLWRRLRHSSQLAVSSPRSARALCRGTIDPGA